MIINDLYKQYKDRPVTKLDAETKDYILSCLSSVENVSNVQEANQFIYILALCRGAQAAMDGEKRSNTLRTILSAGDEGSYVDNNNYINERFMYELIQNVDDCQYSQINDCKLKINFDIENDKMVLAYNELGFRPKDVIAISDIGNSTKNHHKSLDQKELGLDKNDFQEIGEKGIGFKSIFGLANKVSIQSGYFNFYFDYSDFTIPKILGEKDRVDGTILTLYLKQGIAAQLYEMLREKYKDNSTIINENPVLFLNKLTEIIYCSEKGYFGFRVSRQKKATLIVGDLINVEYLSSNKDEERIIKCYRYAKEVNYTIDECKARFGKEETSGRKYKIEIITTADLKKVFNGRIYSFFPTRQSITVPMIIHAPFKMTYDRTNITNQSDTADSTNLWFVRTKNETIDFIHFVIEDLAKKIGYKIVNFIPEENLIESKRCPLFDSRLSRDKILSLNLFESIDGKFLSANQLCYLNKADITLEDAIDIYNLLDVKEPLLKKVIREKDGKWYGFVKVDNIDNRLFHIALSQKQNTEKCLKYLKDYEAMDFTGNLKYELNEEQIIAFSEFPKLISYINNQLFENLKNQKNIEFSFDLKSSDPFENINNIIEYCEDSSDNLKPKLYNYVNNVKFIKDECWESPLFLNNCIFGSNIIESFNILFQEIDKKYRLFFSYMQVDEIEKHLDSLICDDTCTDQDFLIKLIKIRKAQKNVLGNQYSRIIDLINEAGTKPQRFLMELLQNIDDCEYEEEPVVKFQLNNNKLIIQYNELGFKKENITSITAIGDSTKQYVATSTTGEKGIGFKSIFNIASKVEIHSNNFHFSLNKSEPTIPKKINSTEITKGTKMVIEIKNGYVDEYFSNEFISNSCLCLKKVKNIGFNENRIIIRDLNNSRIIQFQDNSKKSIDEKKYYKFNYRYCIDNQTICNSRYDNRVADNEQTITYLIPEKIQEGIIYSTFPTLEKLNVPIIVDANLKLNTSREFILGNNSWNDFTIKKIHDGFLWMLEQLKNVNYEKLMDIIPYNGVLTKRHSEYNLLDTRIKKLPIFKVFNTEDDFIALEDGFIAEDLDKYIIKTWGYCNNGRREKIRKNCIDFRLDKITYDKFYEKPSFVGFCEDLADPDSYNVIHPEYLKDDNFRELLYAYLSNYDNEYGINCILQDDYDEIQLGDWKIIPVIKAGKTEYVKYSDDIYYTSQDKVILSNHVQILDQNKMSLALFTFIYYDSQPSRRVIIQEYSDSVVLDSIVNKINEFGDLSDEKKAKEILALYKQDPELFKNTVYRRITDLRLDYICLETRTHEYLQVSDCFFADNEINNNILDHVIVSNGYLELAKILQVKNIKEIDNIENIYDFFDYQSLNELLNLTCLNGNTSFFNCIYKSMFDYSYNTCIENEVFLKLIDKVDPEIALYSEGHFKNIYTSINSHCLNKYGDVLLKIFRNYPNQTLELNENIKLLDFEYYDVLNDIRNDIQTRKNDEKIQVVNSLINNCYYCDSLKFPILPIRLSDNKIILLVNQNITSEHDIVSSFKDFFLTYYSLALNITRDADRYTREGFEQISTIDYSLEEEQIATRIAMKLDFDDVSKIKDYMCKPLDIKGKVIGGYARTCPLCGAKVHTELTGMRLFKFKDEDSMIELISCPNCYENLRYSTNLTINRKDLDKNYLSFKSFVNGEEWNVDHIKIRLGHKAILNVLNKKK